MAAHGRWSCSWLRHVSYSARGVAHATQSTIARGTSSDASTSESTPLLPPPVGPYTKSGIERSGCARVRAGGISSARGGRRGGARVAAPRLFEQVKEPRALGLPPRPPCAELGQPSVFFAQLGHGQHVRGGRGLCLLALLAGRRRGAQHHVGRRRDAERSAEPKARGSRSGGRNLRNRCREVRAPSR